MATEIEPGTTTQQEACAPTWQVDGSEIWLRLRPEGIDFLNQLLRDSREAPEVLFRKALGLYRLALDARKEGLAVGAAASADSLDTQFEL